MKKILGAASAAAAAVACIAVGTAGTASADPELNGTYTLTVDETQSTTTGFAIKNPEVETKQWVVTSCGAGCANVAVPDVPNGGGQLKLVNGRWEMSKDLTLMNCHPGQPDVTVTTSLDPATLQGTEVNTNHCLDNVITSPATLTPA
jgi:hypothetical protein